MSLSVPYLALNDVGHILFDQPNELLELLSADTVDHTSDISCTQNFTTNVFSQGIHHQEAAEEGEKEGRVKRRKSRSLTTRTNPNRVFLRLRR